jgi:hypothetical protein
MFSSPRPSPPHTSHALRANGGNLEQSAPLCDRARGRRGSWGARSQFRTSPRLASISQQMPRSRQLGPAERAPCKTKRVTFAQIVELGSVPPRVERPAEEWARPPYRVGADRRETPSRATRPSKATRPATQARTTTSAAATRRSHSSGASPCLSLRTVAHHTTVSWSRPSLPFSSSFDTNKSSPLSSDLMYRPTANVCTHLRAAPPSSTLLLSVTTSPTWWAGSPRLTVGTSRNETSRCSPSSNRRTRSVVAEARRCRSFKMFTSTSALGFSRNSLQVAISGGTSIRNAFCRPARMHSAADVPAAPSRARVLPCSSYIFCEATWRAPAH